MPTVTASASLAVGAVALLASVVFLGVMARHREEPTARPLLALAVALVVGAGAHLVLVEFAPVRSLFGSGVWSTGFADGLWLLLAYDLGAVVALTWFLFALGYTGRGGFETPVATGAVGALLLALVGANAGFAGLAGPLGVGARPLNVAVGVVLVLATALALIGAFLVLTVAARHRVFPAGQTAAVLGGVGVVLAVPFAATTADAPATTPLGITAASVCFSVAVVRYRLFETLPVATVVGRDRVGDEIAEGVLVVDAERRLRDLNPAAETLFDIEPTAAVGDSLERVAPGLPDPETLVDGDPVDVRVGSGDESSRVASVAADPVTDAQGRRVGYLLVCRDVTARRARAQRLGVLTQLVAGVTRDRMRAVADAADEAVAAESSPDESPGEGPSGDRSPGEEPPTVESAADRAWETSTRLAALVARVRDVDRALADRGDASTDPERAAGADADGEAASGGPVREEARTDAGRAEGVDLAAAVSGLADRREAGDVTVSVPDEVPPVAVDSALLEATLGTLVVGAASGAGSSDDPDPGPVEVSVRPPADGAVGVAVTPLPAGEADAVAALARRVARLAADRTDLAVETPAPETVALRVPVVEDGPSGGGRG
jgi:PAS domain-containing protein